MSNQPAFDKDGALARVDNDIELYKELIGILFADYEQNVAAIRSALATLAGTELREQAHSIKSALGNVGAMRAHAAAYELEKSGKAGDFTAVPTQISELEAAVAAFRAALAADPTFT